MVWGALSSEQADLAEAHLRELTAAIARGRFPPPLVRNWQLDLSRIAAIQRRETSTMAWGRAGERRGDCPEGNEKEANQFGPEAPPQVERLAV